MALANSLRATYNAVAGPSRLLQQRCTCRCYATAVDARDPYTILGLDRSAQAADIKARYYDLVKEHHPDKGGKDTPEAKEAFSLIIDAYTLLRNPTSRAAYLQSGIGWDHGGGGATARGGGGGAARPDRPADTTDRSGFHTGRRRAFDERHRPATSREEYARFRAARAQEAERRYTWDRPTTADMKPDRSMDGTWTQYQNMEGDASKPIYTMIAFTLLSLIIIINKPRKVHQPNAGTEAYARGPEKQMVDRLKQARASQ